MPVYPFYPFLSMGCLITKPTIKPKRKNTFLFDMPALYHVYFVIIISSTSPSSLYYFAVYL